MRIGIDCRLWRESGVGRYTRNLVKNILGIDKKNYYILFCLDRDKKEIAEYLSSANNFKIVKVDIRWHSLSEQVKFPFVLQKEELDLVHFPYFSVPVFYRKPFVITIHDLILHHFPTGEASTLPYTVFYFKLLGYKFVIKKAAQAAEKIITVSNFTKEEIRKHLLVPEEKISVIYEGIDEDLVSDEEEKNNEFDKDFDEDFFLYVGNAYPHKNLEGLISAFYAIHRNHPDTKLFLVGRGDYFYNRLRKKVSSLKLGGVVRFLGEVDDRRLRLLYRKARALIAPSFMEGFSLPVVEAMANNCLVLASDIPVHREIAGDAVLYFSFEGNDFVEKMKMILTHNRSYWDFLRRKGRERAKSFSWQDMARKTLKVYQDL